MTIHNVISLMVLAICFNLTISYDNQTSASDGTHSNLTFNEIEQPDAGVKCSSKNVKIEGSSSFYDERSSVESSGLCAKAKSIARSKCMKKGGRLGYLKYNGAASAPKFYNDQERYKVFNIASGESSRNLHHCKVVADCEYSVCGASQAKSSGFKNKSAHASSSQIGESQGYEGQSGRGSSSSSSDDFSDRRSRAIERAENARSRLQQNNPSATNAQSEESASQFRARRVGTNSSNGSPTDITVNVNINGNPADFDVSATNAQGQSIQPNINISGGGFGNHLQVLDSTGKIAAANVTAGTSDNKKGQPIKVKKSTLEKTQNQGAGKFNLFAIKLHKNNDKVTGYKLPGMHQSPTGALTDAKTMCEYNKYDICFNGLTLERGTAQDIRDFIEYEVRGISVERLRGDNCHQSFGALNSGDPSGIERLKKYDPSGVTDLENAYVNCIKRKGGNTAQQGASAEAQGTGRTYGFEVKMRGSEPVGVRSMISGFPGSTDSIKKFRDTCKRSNTPICFNGTNKVAGSNSDVKLYVDEATKRIITSDNCRAFTPLNKTDVLAALSSVDSTGVRKMVERGEKCLASIRSQPTTPTPPPTPTPNLVPQVEPTYPAGTSSYVLSLYKKHLRRDAKVDGATYWTNRYTHLKLKEGYSTADAEKRVKAEFLEGARKNGETIY